MTRPLCALAVAACLMPLLPAAAQGAPAPGAKPPQLFPSAPAATAQAPVMPRLSPELKPYESCSFPDGLNVVEVAPMPAEVKSRPVQIAGKTQTVPLLAGRRVVFAYPGTKEPYANAKVEELPAENYAANRKLLLDDFADIVASDKDVARDAARKPTLNGFSITGLNRQHMEGSTLGIYLLIDDATHVATTLYLLNQSPAQRKFKTPEDYGRMRDTFLYNYTRCIRNSQIGKAFGGPQ